MAESIEEKLRRNIDVMNNLEGFDIVIVCCSSSQQASYWQKRLEDGRGSVLAPGAVVIAVEEDWPGGAGNALGTLYAFHKASIVAQSVHGRSILAELSSSSISIGLYHTAGKGTRLAPLPGSENNNKPGVKLPATVSIAGKNHAITILESVVKQTACYARSRRGRLSVFWGDQVFIPSAPVHYTVTHHADILCSLGPMMSAEEWTAKGMEKYGLVALMESGQGAQVEKVSHATAVQLLSNLGVIQSVGVSLGSFSVSSALLACLLEEFSSEVAQKRGKLDSDPHLWMPMTLARPAYAQLMRQKGQDEEKSFAHYDRIAQMLERFRARPDAGGLGLFGPVDVGQGVYWWDYGQLRLYHQNTLKLTEDSKEAAMMRLFLGINENDRVRDSTLSSSVSVDAASCLSSSTVLGGGSITRSVLCNVRCRNIEAQDAVLINVTADRIVATASGVVLYNYLAPPPSYTAEAPVDTEEGRVKVGVTTDAGVPEEVRSALSLDGGVHWDNTICGNALSFAQLYDRNAEADPAAREILAQQLHDAAWATIQSL